MASRWTRLYPGTPAELALEPAVAALGVPYRFQHPMFLFDEPSGVKLRYFPDFLLLRERVVIEVDDDGHFTAAGRRRDSQRTKLLTEAGYRVIRCTNADAMRYPYATVNRMMRQLGLSLTAEPPASAGKETP
jgi:hypothetical protein